MKTNIFLLILVIGTSLASYLYILEKTKEIEKLEALSKQCIQTTNSSLAAITKIDKLCMKRCNEEVIKVLEEMK